MLERRIKGSILRGGRFYRAGDEDEFVLAMSGRPIAHLLERGDIEGDWSDHDPSAPNPLAPNPIKTSKRTSRPRVKKPKTPKEHQP